MNATEAHDLVIRTVLDIAPDVGVDEIAPDIPLQEQLDFDSMDFLSLVTALSEATGVDVPESDYPRLATLEGCEDFVMRAA